MSWHVTQQASSLAVTHTRRPICFNPLCWAGGRPASDNSATGDGSRLAVGGKTSAPFASASALLQLHTCPTIPVVLLQ